MNFGVQIENLCGSTTTHLVTCTTLHKARVSLSKYLIKINMDLYLIN